MSLTLSSLIFTIDSASRICFKILSIYYSVGGFRLSTLTAPSSLRDITLLLNILFRNEFDLSLLSLNVNISNGVTAASVVDEEVSCALMALPRTTFSKTELKSLNSSSFLFVKIFRHSGSPFNTMILFFLTSATAVAGVSFGICIGIGMGVLFLIRPPKIVRSLANEGVGGMAREGLAGIFRVGLGALDLQNELVTIA